ncbi:hypothetical protein TRVA0_029S01530 [Trichomonascus vanleenenianus]|uniref:uncharacterized protein n=1 Tax=Trichomonascus vanleenenianus TaxID=2268995 RepID=UPI003ECB3BCD
MAVSKSLLLAIATALVATVQGQSLLPGDQVDPGFKVNPSEHLPVAKMPLPLPLSNGARPSAMGGSASGIQHPPGIIVPSTFSIRTRNPSVSTVEAVATNIRPMPLLTATPFPAESGTGNPTAVGGSVAGNGEQTLASVPTNQAINSASISAGSDTAITLTTGIPTAVGGSNAGNVEQTIASVPANQATNSAVIPAGSGAGNANTAIPLATGTATAADGSIAGNAEQTLPPVPSNQAENSGTVQADTLRVPGIEIIREQQRKQQEEIDRQLQQQAEWLKQIQAQHSEQAQHVKDEQAQQQSAGNIPSQALPKVQPLLTFSRQDASQASGAGVRSGYVTAVSASSPTETNVEMSPSNDVATAGITPAMASNSNPSGQAEAETYQSQLADEAKNSNAKSQVEQQANVPDQEPSYGKRDDNALDNTMMEPVVNSLLHAAGPVIPNKPLPSALSSGGSETDVHRPHNVQHPGYGYKDGTGKYNDNKPKIVPF